MASIVQRNKSFAVIYQIKTQEGTKQKWETYHSKEDAEKRKWEIENMSRVYRHLSETYNNIGFD